MNEFCLISAAKVEAFVPSKQRKEQETALQVPLQTIDLLRVITLQDFKTLQGSNGYCKSVHYRHALQGGGMDKNRPRQLIL